MRRREFIALLVAPQRGPRRHEARHEERIPTVGVLWHAANAEEEKFPLCPISTGIAGHWLRRRPKYHIGKSLSCGTT